MCPRLREGLLEEKRPQGDGVYQGKDIAGSGNSMCKGFGAQGHSIRSGHYAMYL